MRPAFCARWDGFEWTPQTNDAENQRYEHVDAPWPEGFDRARLPTPRFGPGAHIRFRWCDGYLCGTVIEVRTYLTNDLRGAVVYDVREIGHRRTVWDNGHADIVVIP